MKKHFCILLCIFLLACPGWSQTKAPGGEPPKKTNPAPTTAVNQNSQNVLFATNEDCDLFINDEPKGIIQKAEFSYLKLAPGTYTYKARSKNTLDELTGSFTVTEGCTNEIFIDLLLVV